MNDKWSCSTVDRSSYVNWTLNFMCCITDKGYTVSVHLGKVLDPYTKLYLQLCGEKEESTKIVLRPSGTATDTFQEGKTYKFSVEMPDIGKVL